MSDIVIRAESVSKLYLLGQTEQRHESLLGELSNLLTSPIRKFRDLRRLDTSRAGSNGHAIEESPDLLWALKDVSFEVKQGEVVGIIGRNGAGKSTLLKILSRITEPTQGRVRMKGRVASLLEVGTGFHPELTGRENVYLNGTILGMTRREIERRFDEIVEFSGVERFLDTPVKRYSSGMKVRLGFAVAAHLDPEILIVDEVLAVGDADFQRRCLGRMGEFAQSGRTVFLVSHNMGSIAALCKTVLLMKAGRVALHGPADEAIQEYLRLGGSATASLLEHPGRAPGAEAAISDLVVLGGEGKTVGTVLCGDPCELVLTLNRSLPSNAIFNITLYDTIGVAMAHFSTRLVQPTPRDGSPRNEARCIIDQLNLLPGRYFLNVAYTEGDRAVDHVSQARTLDVVESNFLGSGRMPSNSNAKIVLKHHWAYGVS